MPKTDSTIFDFGETIDYDTADKILTGAGLRLEKDGYNYSRNEHQSGVAHSAKETISQGKNHQEYFYMSVDIDRSYKGDEVKISAASNVLKGSSQVNLSNELKEFERSLEEECKRVL